MRSLRALPVAVLLASCSSQPTIVPVRNLERPSDMTFVCLGSIGSGDQRRLSGRPMARCHPPSAADVDPFLETPRLFGTFAFIANSARGELSVVDMDTNTNANPPTLVDLDPSLPGYNTVPIGVFPEMMAASQDGCRVVTANRGSCDLTLIDPQRLLTARFGVAKASTDTGPVTEHVTINTGSHRPLAVAPKEIVFLPQALKDLNSQALEENACLAGDGAYVGPAGNDVPAARTPWRALVTFPGCDLVAMVELPSGTIVSSVYIRPDRVEDAGTEPVCPVECGPGITPPADASAVASQDAPAAAGGDATVADGGGPGDAAGAAAPTLAGPLRVGALAVLPDGKRVYVGAEGAPFVSALDITASGLTIPGDGGRIPLHDDAGGVTRLRLSVDPYRPSADMQSLGRFIGDRGDFLYAIARDDSIRLVDVGARLTLSTGMKERECDTNIDPLFLGSLPNGPDHGCYFVEDPQMPPLQRRALTMGPGIRIPTVFTPDVPPPLPRDIAFAHVKGTPNVSGAVADPALDGDFGYVLASNGAVYVLRLDPRTLTLDPQPPFTGSTRLMNHSFVNFNLTQRGQGPARVNVLPGRNFTFTEVPLPAQITLLPLRGPRLESVSDSDATSGIVIYSWARFPDQTAATPQTWQITWEGQLPNTARLEGEVEQPVSGSGSAGALRDLGVDFCDSGVLNGDILLFPGCTLDTDCFPAGTAVCRQAAAGSPGLCFPRTAVKDEKFAENCRRHLGSRRRYEIVSSTPGRLELGLKIDEVPRTSLTPCTPKERQEDDTDCRVAPAYAGFRCLQVRAEDRPRCVQPCGIQAGDGSFTRDDTRCRVGTVCEDVPGSVVGPLCVEGPPLDQKCWPVQSSYRVQAGNSFIITGTAAPIPPVARTAGGQCVADLSRHQLLVNRIPLDAPRCEQIPDGTTVAKALEQMPQGPTGTWGNPCLFQAPNDDEGETTTGSPFPAVCTERACHVKALFQNQQVRFVMTNLEEYAGDAAISYFDVTGGFRPATADYPDDVIITAGVRILQGPIKTPESPGPMGGTNEAFVVFPYLFVVDQGRTASSLASRGQVLRLNPRTGTLGIPRFDGIFTVHPFQIQ
jgi:hypothetical protein